MGRLGRLGLQTSCKRDRADSGLRSHVIIALGVLQLCRRYELRPAGFTFDAKTDLNRRCRRHEREPGCARIARISRRRLLDTRRAAASHLIANGSDAVTDESVLGHESAAITLAIYSHAFDFAKHDATDRLGARMERIASGNYES